MKINWKIFEGSSHCEEGLALFAMGEIKTYKDFEKWFLPHMKDQAQEVVRMKKSPIPISRMRVYASRAYKRITNSTVTEAFG